MTGKYLLFPAVWLKAIWGGYVYPIPAENPCQNANTGLFSPTDTFWGLPGRWRVLTGRSFYREKICPFLRFPGQGLWEDISPIPAENPCQNANTGLLQPS